MFNITFNTFFFILCIVFVVMAMGGFVKQYASSYGSVSYYVMWAGFFGCAALVLLFIIGCIFAML